MKSKLGLYIPGSLEVTIFLVIMVGILLFASGVGTGRDLAAKDFARGKQWLEYDSQGNYYVVENKSTAPRRKQKISGEDQEAR